MLRRQFKHAACFAVASLGSAVVVELDGDVSSMLAGVIEARNLPTSQSHPSSHYSDANHETMLILNLREADSG